MPSKLDLILIAGIAIAVMGWIEHSHGVVIDSPDVIELASPAAGCSEDQGFGYGASQMILTADGFVSTVAEATAVSEADATACQRK